MSDLKPIVKWVGGKRQLLNEIGKLVPDDISLYVEPFVGGGAVLLHFAPPLARINDANDELINVYKVVRDRPDELLHILHALEEAEVKPGSDLFYRVRSLDRAAVPGWNEVFEQALVDRAARIIYLNKTCYNGLFRVNQQGQLNAPYGYPKHPNIVNERAVRALSAYLNQPGVEIMEPGDYTKALAGLPEGAFVYLDPPYMPVSPSSSFTGYTAGGFDEREQKRLYDECVRLDEAGIRFLQSNSSCDAIKALYQDRFSIRTVSARRSINSKARGRGPVEEVLITNVKAG